MINNAKVQWVFAVITLSPMIVIFAGMLLDWPLITILVAIAVMIIGMIGLSIGATKGDKIQVLHKGMYRNCKYCGNESTGIFCNDDCETKSASYYAKEKKYAPLIFLGIALSFVPMFLVIFGMHIFTALGLLLIIAGSTAFILPFGTEWTVERYGIVKSIRIIRVCALAIILWGAAHIVDSLLL